MERTRRRTLWIAEGYRLATAEILYRMPDHPALLQTYVWQDYDLPPSYPALTKFLDFWRANLDGELYSVRVASAQLIGPGKMRHVQHSLALH